MGSSSGVEPLQYLPAPLAFVAGVIALATILAREIRKVLAERNADQTDEIKALRDDVASLTEQIEDLRDRGLKRQEEVYEAQLEQERKHQDARLDLVREISRLRQKLIRAGVEPDGPDDLDGLDGSETP